MLLNVNNVSNLLNSHFIQTDRVVQPNSRWLPALTALSASWPAPPREGSNEAAAGAEPGVAGEREVEGKTAVWAAARLPPSLPPGTCTSTTCTCHQSASGATASSHPGAALACWGTQLTFLEIRAPTCLCLESAIQHWMHIILLVIWKHQWQVTDWPRASVSVKE